MGSVEGHLDEVHGDYVTGWAWDPESPDDPVLIAVWTDKTSKPVYGRADIYRKDLHESGKGSGHCAFQIEIDYKDSQRIHAKAFGREGELLDSPSYVRAAAAIMARDLPLHRDLLRQAATRIAEQMLDR